MKQFLAHKEEYRGLTIKIYADDSYESPREWDNLGHMVCFHNRYILGDSHNINCKDFDSWKEMKEYLIKEKKAILISPLYLYDHSGLTMKIGSFDGLLPQGHSYFDSGQVGFIYITIEDVKKEFGVKKINKKVLEKAQKILEEEVKTYNNYLSGNVWGFIIKDKNEKNIDSCWGFFGDYREWALKDAKSSIDHLTNKGKTDHTGQFIANFIKK